MFNTRGLVIGIPIGLLMLQQNLIGAFPVLSNFLPWNQVAPLGEQLDSVAAGLMMGSNNFDPMPLVVITLESFLFIILALVRFHQ